MRNSETRLRGRALITGGTSGIGRAFAFALAARGVDLVLVARSSERLESTREAISERYAVRCDVLSADLSSGEGYEAVARRLASDEAPVNIFVNNAGQGLYHELATNDTAPLEAGIELMGTVVVKLGGVASAAMVRRGNGVIINTASVSGLVPMGLYSGIKALVRTWSLSLGIEVAPAGVQVMTFMPGWVRTEFHKRAGVERSNLPGFLWLDADRVVRDCLADVEKGKRYSIPSKRFKVIAALAEHAPKRVVWAVTEKINKGRR
ncbi:SDR family NAD(P)-dependent oxidoreductase [Arcanobacterium haemolyticum]|nr:SDR family NAD(P)-dependent oxidoreductase [Arcanobacterium haemolyticum]